MCMIAMFENDLKHYYKVINGNQQQYVMSVSAQPVLPEPGPCSVQTGVLVGRRWEDDLLRVHHSEPTADIPRSFNVRGSMQHICGFLSMAIAAGTATSAASGRLWDHICNARC